MDCDYHFNDAKPELMGVCARLANFADVDPLLVRTNFVLAGLLFAPLAILAYLLAGAYLHGFKSQLQAVFAVVPHRGPASLIWHG